MFSTQSLVASLYVDVSVCIWFEHKALLHLYVCLISNVDAFNTKAWLHLYMLVYRYVYVLNTNLCCIFIYVDASVCRCFQHKPLVAPLDVDVSVCICFEHKAMLHLHMCLISNVDAFNPKAWLHQVFLCKRKTFEALILLGG
jgi:hypothetical protein